MSDAPTAFAEAVHEVAYAYFAVPFFRRHMDDAGCAPTDLRRPSDLERIPPTVKAQYRSNFPHGVLAAGHGLDDPMLRRLQSSGTEGDRLLSVTYVFTLAERMATSLQMNPRYRFLSEASAIKTCRFAAPNCSDVECANPNSTMQDRTLPDGTLVLPVYHDLLTTPDAMLEQAAAEMSEYDPNLFYVDPVHMTWLAAHLARRGVQRWPGKRQAAVILSYTMPTHGTRRRIETFFGPGVPVAGALAMSEFGYLGMECQEGTLHLNTTDFYLEFVRDGQPGGPGELAELYVTTLRERVSPKIRYRTGDFYRRHHTPCRCGSAHPAVTYEGRRKNLLTAGGGRRVTPREVDDVIGVRSWIDLYQLSQLGADRFVLRFVGERSPDAREEESLRGQLADLLASSNVRCVHASYIASERGGKFSACKGPDEAAT
jgi:phenylacetate-CoA ligase